MKAFIRSARIAPKKLSVIAKMVRGMPVPEALDALALTHKKAARIVELLLKSAVANAVHNDKQKEEDLVVKTVIVNQAQSYRRGVPMARGRMRPMRKFLSHIEIGLGIAEEDNAGEEPVQKIKKNDQKPSQKDGKAVKEGAPKKSKTKKSSVSSPSSPSL